ncbi:MAG: nicotinamide riboside transporter PnuC [Muribaculaceae bacterium]|nr:nicotinamide riboside transporter PnuC [Muribaculaceae bacterium]
MIDTSLQIAGLAIGLIYLWYEYHASPKVWIAGLFMPMISMVVYYRKGLYADFGMNIYYLLMAVYGYLAWTGMLRRGKGSDGEKGELEIRHLRPRAYLPVVAVTGVIWVCIALFLIGATDSTVPWADAFTTAMSITGTWLLARKYIDQWFAWVLVDAVCVGLYLYKGIYPYALLYAVYTVVAVFGYYKWKRLMAGTERPAA